MTESFTARYSADLNVSEEEARHLLAVLGDAFASALDEAGRVTLERVGAFTVKERRGRTGRNPVTRRLARIPPSKTIAFTPCEPSTRDEKTRSALVSHTANRLGRSTEDAARLLDTLSKAVSAALDEEGRAELAGFGTFLVRARQELAGRNPRTGEAIVIPGYRVTGFRGDPAVLARIRFSWQPPPEHRRPRSEGTSKAADELDERDLEDHALWVFDAERDESTCDKSVGRPCASIEPSSCFGSTFFARARVVPADGSARAGAMAFRVEDAEPSLERLVVFGPEPFDVPFGIEATPAEVEEVFGPVRHLLPARYETCVAMAVGPQLEISGVADPWRFPRTPPP